MTNQNINLEDEVSRLEERLKSKNRQIFASVALLITAVVGTIFHNETYDCQMKGSKSLETGKTSIVYIERAPREVYNKETRSMTSDPAYVASMSKYASGMNRRYTLSKAAAGLSARLGQ